MVLKLRGPLTILASSLFFGSYGVWARLIGPNIDNLVQVWTRSLIIIAILFPLGLATGSLKRIKYVDLPWFFIITLFGTFTVAPFFYAANTIGVGPATLLFYASFTIISYLLGVALFAEQLTRSKIVSLILALIGLALIFGLSFETNSIAAPLAAIFSGLAGGVEVVVTKKVSPSYSALQISLILWLVIFVSHFLLTIIFHIPPPHLAINTPWLAVVGYAIASLSAFYLVVVGYKYVEPSVGGIIGLMEVVFGVIFGLILFQEPLTLNLIWGTILILSASAIPNVKDLVKSSK